MMNIYFYLVGIVFMFLNKIRHTIKGYQTPRPFSMSEFDQAIKYDQDVVSGWLKYLKKYAPEKSLVNQEVLELGPGADLGVGLLLIAKGAKKYNSLDVNNLVKTVPAEFYQRFYQYTEARAEMMDKINYLCDPDFNLSKLPKQSIDLVFGQASFEHFDDVTKTFSQLSQVVKPGAVLISEVDLKTHTRYLRDQDPLNIYRYHHNIYDLFKFAGSPNRIRPHQYQKYLLENGWENVEIYPVIKTPENYSPKLSKQFQDPINQMEYLSIILCATKK